MRAITSSAKQTRLSKHWTLAAASLPCNSQLIRAGPASLRHRILHDVWQLSSLLQHRNYQSTYIRHEDPTIYALSTAPGKAAIAVIRASGPACKTVQLHTILRQSQSNLAIDIQWIVSLDCLPEATLCDTSKAIQPSITSITCDATRCWCARPVLPCAEHRDWRRRP
jgi:hypothetical protein